jgi:hypothetical protein
MLECYFIFLPCAPRLCFVSRFAFHILFIHCKEYTFVISHSLFRRCFAQELLRGSARFDHTAVFVHSIKQAQQMSDGRMGGKARVSCTSYSVISKAF